jgi:hypothetical protein
VRHDTIVSLDLGQSNDYSAWSVLQPAGDDLHIRHLERVRGVPYPVVVQRTVELLATPGLGRVALVLDRTGVGRAVFDQFVAANLRPVGISVHGGDQVIREPVGSGWRVPKRDLIGALLVPVQTGRFKVAASLEHAETLMREMVGFRVTINAATGHDSYAAWREQDHDDVLLSVAMACWYAARHTPPQLDIQPLGVPRADRSSQDPSMTTWRRPSREGGF